MVRALGGAWAAGRMLRAVTLMMDTHPRGRVVAASHGDVIPVLLAALSGSFGIPRAASLPPRRLVHAAVRARQPDRHPARPESGLTPPVS
jgi:broad specificity phosphatase PhoE